MFFVTHGAPEWLLLVCISLEIRRGTVVGSSFLAATGLSIFILAVVTFDCEARTFFALFGARSLIRGVFNPKYRSLSKHRPLPEVPEQNRQRDV